MAESLSKRWRRRGRHDKVKVEMERVIEKKMRRMTRPHDQPKII